jgi:hypothetical protein
VSANAPNLERHEGLYRFIHPNNSNADGTVNSGAFHLRRDKQISLGIESMIQAKSFERFCEIKPSQGVAKLQMGDLIDLFLWVELDSEPEWGEFADAHTLLRGYSEWPNKKKEEIGRRLRDLANQRIIKAVPRPLR